MHKEQEETPTLSVKELTWDEVSIDIVAISKLIHTYMLQSFPFSWAGAKYAERALKTWFSGWIQMIRSFVLLAKESGVCPEGYGEPL